jgi:hypothetical protein
MYSKKTRQHRWRAQQIRENDISPQFWFEFQSISNQTVALVIFFESSTGVYCESDYRDRFPITISTSTSRRSCQLSSHHRNEGDQGRYNIIITMICSNIRRCMTNRKIIIVDWDDTILPSTFVDRWQIENSQDQPQHVSPPPPP